MRVGRESATQGAVAVYDRLLFRRVVLVESSFVLLSVRKGRLAAERTAWCFALSKELDHGFILKHACCPHVGKVSDGVGDW